MYDLCRDVKCYTLYVGLFLWPFTLVSFIFKMWCALLATEAIFWLSGSLYYKPTATSYLKPRGGDLLIPSDFQNALR